MLTGPEHYKEAERLATLSRGQELDSATVTLQEAQVHATLAVAAATALTGYVDPTATVTPDELAWDKAAGVKREASES